MRSFGGDHVPRGIVLSLKKMLAAATLYRFKETERLFANSLAQVAASSSETDRNVQYWYVYRTADGEIKGYVNIEPGEFSAELPTGNVIILDPQPDAAVQFKKELQQLINDAKDTAGELFGEEENILCKRLQLILEQEDTEDAAKLTSFRTAATAVLFCGDLQQREILYRQLIKDFYDNYALPLVDFSLCNLLVEIQLQVGGVVSEDIYRNPLQGLSDLLEAFRDHPRAGEISNIANNHYNAAGKALMTSISTESYELFIAKQRYAALLYYSSTVLGKALLQFDIQNSLKYKPGIAEEGWACSSSAVFSFDFVTSSIADYIGMMSHDLEIQGAAFDDYFINRFATVTRPYFPRKLANAMLAAAKVQCGIDLAEQIGVLRQIENDLLSGPGTGSFDLWMVEMQLLSAYKKTNDVAMQQKYSTRAAARYFL